MKTYNILAIISANGPMQKKGTQVVSALWAKDDLELLDGLEWFLNEEVDRAEGDSGILEKVGKIEGCEYGYNKINEALYDFEFNTDTSKKKLKLKNAVKVDRVRLPFLPLKTVYQLDIFLVDSDADLNAVGGIAVKDKYSDYESAGPRFPIIEDFYYIDKLVDTDRNETFYELKSEDNSLIQMSESEFEDYLKKESRTFVDIADPEYTFSPKIFYYKPTGEVDLKEVGSIVRKRYKVLDLSEAIWGMDLEKWRVCLGYSHSGPVYGASGVREVEVLKKLLKEVSADLVVLPDDVSRRHINTILNNHKIKKVKVSENCKLFAMEGDKLYNKKKTKVIM